MTIPLSLAKQSVRTTVYLSSDNIPSGVASSQGDSISQSCRRLCWPPF